MGDFMMNERELKAFQLAIAALKDLQADEVLDEIEGILEANELGGYDCE